MRFFSLKAFGGLIAGWLAGGMFVGEIQGAAFSGPRSERPIGLSLFASAKERPYLQLGPMVGHTTSTNARIWAKASGKTRLSVLVSSDENLADSRRVKGPVLDADSDFMGTVLIPDLEPEQRYYYCLVLGGKRVMNRPYPSFSTPAAEGSEGRVRFAFISCLGYHGYNAAASWGDLTRTNFDMVLMLGDNHYANSSKPEVQRPAYYSHRSVAGFRDISESTPVYAIWDDHDYGPDNSDGTLSGKERSLQTFKEFWANPAYGQPDHPGVYYKFTRNNVDFFMLDGRYYRTPNKLTNAPNRTMLGEAQLAWLKRKLLASQAPVKIIASGSEWQSSSTSDCWISFRRERDEILNFIQENGITGVILISGDRHFAAAYQVLGKFIEVTSGPFGSSNAKTKNLPEMFLKFIEGRLYCIFDIDTTGAEPKVTLEIYRAGDGLLVRRPFRWEEVLGGATIEPLPPEKPRQAAGN